MSQGTALVTGASSGIGAEFARQLAAEGLDPVLVARRADRLAALGEELAKRYSVRCQTIAVDLSQPDAPQRIFAETESKGLKVDFDSNELGYSPSWGPAKGQIGYDGTFKPDGILGSLNVSAANGFASGIYTYFCRIHPFMRGAFEVTK